MWRYLIPVGLFAALVGFFFVSLHRDKETLPSPLIGKAAPAFQLSSVEDPAKQVGTGDFTGRPYVLNIWGSWCVGCREEHEVLLQIARRNEIPLVGLNWKDQRDAAQQWLRQLGNPYTETAFDPEGRAGIDWGAYGAPETFLVDANGIILHKHVAPMTIEIWEQEFLPRIRQAGAARP